MARGRTPVARNKVIKWIETHPDVEFTVAEVVADTKTTPAVTRDAIMKARNGLLPGLRKVNGRAYFYDPSTAGTPHDNGVHASDNGKAKPRGRKPKAPLPTTMNFKVVAELGEGRVLLRFKDDFFTLKPVVV